MNTIDKTSKTIMRIDTVKEEIKMHLRNINLLRWYENTTYPKAKGTFAPRTVKYTTLPKSEKRFKYTIQNLTRQMQDLEKELSVLIEYGA